MGPLPGSLLVQTVDGKFREFELVLGRAVGDDTAHGEVHAFRAGRAGTYFTDAAADVPPARPSGARLAWRTAWAPG